MTQIKTELPIEAETQKPNSSYLSKVILVEVGKSRRSLFSKARISCCRLPINFTQQQFAVRYTNLLTSYQSEIR